MADTKKALLRREEAGGVSGFELLFDLVFVLALSQLSHRLLTRLTPVGFAETAVLLMLTWGVWSATAWVTNWFDPERLSVRLMLVLVMAASLVMAIAIPNAFDEFGLIFAIAYGVAQAGRAAFGAIALGRSRGTEPLVRVFQRTFAWHVTTTVLLVVGASAESDVRLLVWSLALVFSLLGPAFGHYTPGLSRTPTSEWPVRGEHLAERYWLFMLIAIGESLLITGTSLWDSELSLGSIVGPLVVLLLTVSLWWLYFDRSAQVAADAFSAADNPGRVGLTAYAYLHLPMVAGIIGVAASGERAVLHPADPATTSTVALAAGGIALFMSGHALFERVTFRRWPWPHFVALTLLAALAPILVRIATLTALLVIFVIVAILDVVESLGLARSRRVESHE